MASIAPLSGCSESPRVILTWVSRTCRLPSSPLHKRLSKRLLRSHHRLLNTITISARYCATMKTLRKLLRALTERSLLTVIMLRHGGRRVWCTLRHSQSLSRLQRTQESKSSLAWKNSRAGRNGLELQGEPSVGFSAPFYLSYQEQDNRPVFERYGALCARAMGYRSDGYRSAPPIFTSANTSRIRIRVVSTDIREHSVWFALIKGWLQHLDRKRFDIGIFSLTSSPDGETEWAKLHSDFFVSGSKSVQEWMESIAELNPSVLIYPAIGLDVMTLQLASLRLASTQITTWGHPGHVPDFRRSIFIFQARASSRPTPRNSIRRN